jgi:DNA-binding SARP family transcriptional activator/predicted ATPase
VLQLTLLGFPQVAVGGRELTFARRGAVALLVYLALTRRAHSRDSLAALLADEIVDERARQHLGNVLHELTSMLGDYIIATGQTLAFDVARSYTLDSEIFEAALAVAKDGGGTDALQLAVDSFQQELLEGFSLRHAPAFEEWLLLERERLNCLLTQALALLCRRYARSGDYKSGLVCATRWLSLDPWDEDAHRQSMRLLALSGRRRAAIAQYEQCRRFAADLGVVPEAETTALYEQLRRAPVPPIHNLPPQPTPFVGRKHELAQLAEQLEDSCCQLITIVGMGGVGKTRLALQAATAYVSASGTLDMQLFPDGVYYVALDQVAAHPAPRDGSAATASRILSAIAATLGLPTHGPADLAAQLYGSLHQRRLLLVLDNVEHLRCGVRVLEELLRQTPHVKLLLTARVPLGLDIGRTLELGPMDLPCGPDDLECADASVLFLQQAQQACMTFEPSEVDRRAIVRICQLADGLPLAILLAARQLRTAPCTVLAARMSRDLTCLRSCIRNLPERHRSLRASFAYSWSLLDSAQRRALRRLAIFDDTFSLEAASFVASATKLHFESLGDAGLLAATADGQFAIPRMFRRYVVHMLHEQPAEHAEIQARLAIYMRKTAPATHAACPRSVWASRLHGVDGSHASSVVVVAGPRSRTHHAPTGWPVRAPPQAGDWREGWPRLPARAPLTPRQPP